MSIISKVRGQRPRVVVIGGGATGTGIAAEAAKRGYSVVLVERGELGSGTSSHFHGILHSGGRYAVNDPQTATECYQENQILRMSIPSAVTDTGGLFVALNYREAEHAELWLKAATAAGIPVQEISITEALKREPHLSHKLTRAFTVPDGFIKGDEVIKINRRSATEARVPATFLTHHRVTGFELSHGRISAVNVASQNGGAAETIMCDYVISAAGVWAGQVARLAYVDLPMVFDKGTMITFKQELTRAVINRCRPEADGDLLVPSGHGSIMGTTARVIGDPDDCVPTQEECNVLMHEGIEMVPQLARADATRIYAGVRPLFGTPSGSNDTAASNTRAISRSFKVLDHEPNGVSNFMSVVGGKVTLYRRMAAAAVDLLGQKSGHSDKPAKPSGRLRTAAASGNLSKISRVSL